MAKSILNFINKATRIKSNYNFIDTIVAGAFRFSADPVSTTTWFIMQLIFNALLDASVNNPSIPQVNTNKLPSTISNTTVAKTVYSHVLKKATQAGKDYIKEVMKTPPLIVKSRWINEIWWVPNPTNKQIGSIGVSFIQSTTNNKPNVLTPPWFDKSIFENFKKAQSKGNYYLEKIAIKRLGSVLEPIATIYLETQFYNQAKYYDEIKGLYDFKARAKIIENSNYLKDKLFPGANDVWNRLDNNIKTDLDSIVNREINQHTNNRLKDLAKAQAIYDQLKLKTRQISKLQTISKLVARGIRNPEELIKNTIAAKVRSSIPYAKSINNIIDIYTRKGANFKQIAKIKLRNKAQKNLNRYFINLQTKKIDDKIKATDYKINLAYLGHKTYEIKRLEQEKVNWHHEKIKINQTNRHTKRKIKYNNTNRVSIKKARHNNRRVPRTNRR